MSRHLSYLFGAKLIDWPNTKLNMWKSGIGIKLMKKLFKDSYHFCLKSRWRGDLNRCENHRPVTTDGNKDRKCLL